MPNFLIFLLALIMGILFFLLWRYVDKKKSTLVFVSELSPIEIVERMKHHNVKDRISYDFMYDEELQHYILIAKEIRNDRFYNVGTISYRFQMQQRNKLVLIELEKMSQSLWSANWEYSYNMQKFMEKKLNARYIE